MENSIERLWTSFISSDRFRQFAKWGIGAGFFRSRPYQQLLVARRYISSYQSSLRDPAFFQHVNTFCTFIGHTKSGGTMLGSLLDAHPNVILADEADSLQYVSVGFCKDQIFYILLNASRREALKGRTTARRLTPYSFLVPGQWQGRYGQLKVIGDSKAGATTTRIAQDPTLLPRLRAVMGEVNVRLIQVIRNPYDPISVMIVRGKRSFENAIEHYFNSCKNLLKIRQQADSTDLLPIRYEDFLRYPEMNLVNLCHFLGLEAQDDYIKACVDILYKSPDMSRRLVAWDSHWIGVVEQKMAQFDFLDGYSFEYF